MTIQELKKQIEDKSIGGAGIVFVSDNTFIPKQYITEISKLTGKAIHYVDTVEQLKETKSLFGVVKSNDINVYITDSIDQEITPKEYSYAICSKYGGKNGVKVPPLEPWHLVDYAVTNSSKSIGSKTLEELVKACGNDPYKLDNELSKFIIFEDKYQKDLYNNLYESNQLSRNFEGTIFDFTTALLEKDVTTLIKFYSDIQNYDIEPLGVVTIIYKQLRNIIMVGFNKNPTAKNTGLSEKQIYWIKKNLGKYNSSLIVRYFQFICEAEKLLKEGTITNNQLLDYVVVNLLL